MVLELKKSGVTVRDAGDLEFVDFDDDEAVSNVRRPRALGRANRKISESVAEALTNNRWCLAVGGDHSLAIGTIHGHAAVEPNVGVIWVDAHGDINPPLQSASGNAHGMPLAFLVHELTASMPNDLPEFEWMKPCLHAKDIAYIALRDVDEAEKEIMKRFNMVAYYMDDVRKIGIETVVQKCIEHVSPNGTRPIHLSFDIDALDPAHAASTGTPVSGGLTLLQGVYVVETIAKTGRLSVFDLAEVNPEIGSEAECQATLDSAKKIASAWGKGLVAARRQG
jgi:arginase